MYLDHFGLRDKPFRIAPSPKMLYLSETHDEGCARVLYGVQESRGFVVVSGAVGLGKTTVLLSVLEQLDGTVRSALIFNPVDSYSDLLRMICHEYEIECAGLGEVEMLQVLNCHLVESFSRGEICLLLIDEAQNLSFEVLEKLRMLSNLQTSETSLLQIVLVGQPELYDKLLRPRLLQLRQRVGVWHEILPLDCNDTVEYIHHRLRVAGAARPRELISRDLCSVVHAWSGGVPRIINQLCDTAMVIAFGAASTSVDEEHVSEGARELRLDRPDTRHVEDEPEAVQVTPRETVGELSANHGLRVRWGVGALAAALAVALIGAFLVVDWVDPAQGVVVNERPTAALMIEPEPPVQAELAAHAEESVEAPGEQLPAGFVEQFSEINRWRNEGRAVYTAHLASFRSQETAERHAREMQTVGGRFGQPPLVEQVEREDTWYRVLVGGFLSAEAARSFIEALRKDPDVGYAQLALLSGDARLPQVEASQALGGGGNEG